MYWSNKEKVELIVSERIESTTSEFWNTLKPGDTLKISVKSKRCVVTASVIVNGDKNKAFSGTAIGIERELDKLKTEEKRSF